MDIQVVVPPSDITRIEKQLRELDEVFIPHLTGRVNIAEYAEKLADKARIVYACENGGDCGHCAFYVNTQEGSAYITSIAIKPVCQRQGIGQKLVECMKKQCFDMGIKFIRLEVYQTNENAIRFYQRMGYEKRTCDGDWIMMEYCNMRS